MLRTRPMYEGVPPRPGGVYEFCVDGQLSGQVRSSGGDTLIMDIATGEDRKEEGPVATIVAENPPSPERIKDVEIWLPYNELTQLVELRSEAPVAPMPRSTPRWVHHGSSISHSSNAATLNGTWQVIAARGSALDLDNLGLGGSVLVNPFVARTIGDMEADIISISLGINVVNSDVTRRRAFGPAVHGFLDTIRDRQPDTPLILISPIYCPIHENTPGPGAPDFESGKMKFIATGNTTEVYRGKLTLEVIRGELFAIVAQHRAEDEKLFFLDGLELYGPRDNAEFPLADSLHPGAEAHQEMGGHFISVSNDELA
ncbi:GDSL-type esterase/lipase family protein [Corynebacterium flavescens]